MAETPNNTEKTYDVGSNVEKLGFAYLFFRYVWPVVLFIAVLIFVWFFGQWLVSFVAAHPINFNAPALPQAPNPIP